MHPSPVLLPLVINGAKNFECRCGILEDLLELLGGAEIEYPHVYREIAEGRILPGQHEGGLKLTTLQQPCHAFTDDAKHCQPCQDLWCCKSGVHMHLRGGCRTAA